MGSQKFKGQDKTWPFIFENSMLIFSTARGKGTLELRQS